MRRWVWMCGFLGACGAGSVEISIWGEEYIEEGIGADVFADGCSASFSRFEVTVSEVELPGVGVASGETVDLVTPGPASLVSFADVPAGLHDTLIVTVAGEPAVSVAGEMTCGSRSVTFDWTFGGDTVYACEPSALTVPSGGAASAEFTVHGDHLFYDGLSNADAAVRGEAVVDADADADGAVTMAELAAVTVADLGYDVGPYAEVETLDAFIGQLITSLGHIDGEGHCQVE